jgi:hypothetical protein
MLTNTETDNIKRKIGILEKKKSKLESELKDKRSSNTSSWSEYGSELCAGDMIKEEEEIIIEISLIASDIDFLNNVLSYNVSISKEIREMLERNVEMIDRNISDLEMKKAAVTGPLRNIERFEDIMRRNDYT